jgi:hypothetical protein
VQERIATSSEFLESKKDQQEEEEEERRPTESRRTIHPLALCLCLSLTLSNTYDTTEQQQGRKEGI